MSCTIKDCKRMTEGQLLRELVRRFIAYDKARDKYVGFLQKQLEKTGVDYESIPRWEKLHMDQDEKFCLCIEIVRIVKKDPHWFSILGNAHAAASTESRES